MTTLLTAFTPFATRQRNGSQTLLRWLRRHWVPGQYHSRVLPVTWAQAPRLVAGLLQRYQPQRFLALGEGQPSRIVWEMVAHNHAHGLDELGQPPPTPHILPAGPTQRPSTWPAPTAPLHLLPANISFTVSRDAGAFLCNRVLWEALGQPPRQAAFLHLPPQGALSDRAYTAAFAPFVLALLQTARLTPS